MPRNIPEERRSQK